MYIEKIFYCSIIVHIWKLRLKLKRIFIINKSYDLVNNSGSDLSTTTSITTTTIRYYRNNYYNYRSINDNNGTNNSYSHNNNNNIRNMEVLPCGICDNTRGRGTRESGIARHSQTKNPLEFDLKENEGKIIKIELIKIYLCMLAPTK